MSGIFLIFENTKSADKWTSGGEAIDLANEIRGQRTKKKDEDEGQSQRSRGRRTKTKDEAKEAEDKGRRKRMDERELKDIFALLEKQGWKPQLCDTPVPFYDGRVPCGKPNGVGDVECELAMMPREYLPMNRVFMATVTGESMKDANIFAGDVVVVETGVSISDGDIVLVSIDGECTLKTYCEDENGNPWLVPQNPEYDAFPLEENQSIYVAGRVREIIRQAPRIKYKSCLKFIKAAKAKMAEPEEISQVQISKAIREIAPTITVARQWYAVYRVMADLNIVREDDFDTFIDMVKTEVPRHKNLPQRAEMQRMAVDSFAKPLALWRVDNAPVQGKRYNDYLAIAQKTKELLGG